MPWKNTTDRYGAIAKTLHWLIAIAIIAMFVLGYLATNVARGPLRGQLYGAHKSLGLTILIFMIARIIWRFISKPPALPSEMPRSQHYLASLMHLSLYVLSLAMIIVGWAMSAMAGHKTFFWGLADVSFPVGVNRPLANIGVHLHIYGAWLFLVLISLHIIAALHHHFILKNNILRRMWPFAKLKN